MKSVLSTQRPTWSDVLLVLAYWLVVAPVLLVQYAADTKAGWPHELPMVGTTVLFDTSTVALLVGVLLPLLLNGKQRLTLVLVPVFVLLSGWAYINLYASLLEHAVNLSWTRVVLGAVAHAKSYGLLAVLLTGKRYFESQKSLLQLQQAQTEHELRSLKAQIDPHFLFNNLNVLRGLIQQDPAEANEYLGRFANLYRFLIRHKDDDFVPLADELRFVDEYVYLLRHRFGMAYDFRQEILPDVDLMRLLVVPGTVQLLVENAIKHNAGDEDAPLLITIRATATRLTVAHPRRPKRTAIDSLGTGLTNLRERYRLLTQQEIVVTNTAATFAVAVPLLAQARSAVLQPLAAAV